MQPTHVNAVLKLRAERLVVSKRPFMARGATVKRCPRCLIVATHCCCNWARPTTSVAGFSLIMHHKEPLKPTNTGRLIAEIIPSTAAFCWYRIEPDSRLLAYLKDPKWQPYIVFPGQYAKQHKIVDKVSLEAGKTPLFILIDATWAQARKIFNKSPYLADYPVLSISPKVASQYKLRSAAHPNQLATAEVAAQVLALAGDTTAAQILDAYFSVFSSRYQAGKQNKRAPTEEEAFSYLEGLATS